jgi:hypothetical protein
MADDGTAKSPFAEPYSLDSTHTHGGCLGRDGSALSVGPCRP